MLRVIRLEGGVVPRFLNTAAALRGRLRIFKYRRRGITEVFTRNLRGHPYAEGIRFDPATVKMFLTGTFDFADQLPARRGTTQDREEWREGLESHGKRWKGTVELINRWVGPDLEDRMPELQGAALESYTSWVYPIETFDGIRFAWWSFGLAGTGEEILFFRGPDREFNWHSDGWQVPGIGPSEGKKPKRPYPFADVRIREVFTWLNAGELCRPLANETVLRYRGHDQLAD